MLARRIAMTVAAARMAQRRALDLLRWKPADARLMGHLPERLRGALLRWEESKRRAGRARAAAYRAVGYS
jgi:hypothetical protein